MLKQFYIIIIITAFAAIAIVFNTFPRSVKSELEKRTLATFPKFSFIRLCSGDFTKDISLWFSDSEPYRDKLMALSMTIKQYEGIKTTSDNISFITTGGAKQSNRVDERKQRKEEQEENRVTADSDAKISNSGIIITGKGLDVRALMAYGSTGKGISAFSKMVNQYKKAFGEDVKVYCMVIPTAVEYYCPAKAKEVTKPQKPVIKQCYELLDSTVKAVDVYTSLEKRVKEPIYLRTDHHWSPTGGFYAAEKFAKVARTDFKPIAAYERKVIHRYVGSMYGYSQDASIKGAPEDFVYYIPKDVAFTTTYINYKLRKQTVVGEEPPARGSFFFPLKDGDVNAYCTFMGGDAKITKVKTGIKNGRRLAILKDSFGNTLPGYLFYSFEEVHVLDHRYFTPNLVEYVKQNQITDFLIAQNIFNASNATVAKNCLGLLKQ
ncbi:MAG: hypothetical protein HUK06_09865 [Bacteroidaceae bacterium]|nr:hypothetical protein [Bacteroidaceae bacterium]